MSDTKTLLDLAASINILNRDRLLDNPVIHGIQYDSRKIEPGDLFVCIQGEKTDGHMYIDQAVEKGAAALITQHEVETGIPFAIVDDSREAAGLLADVFYDHPTQKLRAIGVTGTNGKTTTTYLLESILNSAGRPVGLTGTNRTRIGGMDYPVERTTPEGIDLQKMAYQMVQAHDQYLVMEVSSHALALHRVAGCEFDIGVFTNLTRDHLDFHKTEEEYLNAKIKLFTGLGMYEKKNSLKANKYAIINVDDPAASRIIEKTEVPVITYGCSEKADVRAVNIRIHSKGTAYDLLLEGQRHEMDMRITGLFNVYNSLAAIAASRAEGLSIEAIGKALSVFPGVPGRFQLVEAGQPFAVIVDYAHTPDGLENILKAARAITKGRVITVFGCGGDRDRTKRPIMGEIAGRLSDLAVITSDNPRSEDPEEIITAVEAGVRSATSLYKKFTDRREAIRYAISQAQPEDAVIIAGKGHETYQILKDKTIHFDDTEEAMKAIGGEKR